MTVTIASVTWLVNHSAHSFIVMENRSNFKIHQVALHPNPQLGCPSDDLLSNAIQHGHSWELPRLHLLPLSTLGIYSISYSIDWKPRWKNGYKHPNPGSSSAHVGKPGSVLETHRSRRNRGEQKLRGCNTCRGCDPTGQASSAAGMWQSQTLWNLQNHPALHLENERGTRQDEWDQKNCRYFTEHGVPPHGHPQCGNFSVSGHSANNILHCLISWSLRRSGRAFEQTRKRWVGPRLHWTRWHSEAQGQPF